MGRGAEKKRCTHAKVKEGAVTRDKVGAGGFVTGGKRHSARIWKRGRLTDMGARHSADIWECGPQTTEGMRPHNKIWKCGQQISEGERMRSREKVSGVKNGGERPSARIW